MDKFVTNDNPVWSLTFIAQVKTKNIVMWETLQNSADWDCLRTRNLLRVEHSVFSEAARSRTFRRTQFFLSCWCAALDSTLHTYMRACGSSQTRDMIGTCCIPARLPKSHPISRHVSQTAPGHARRISIILFHATADDTKFTAPGLRRTPCATPPAGMLFGHLAESSLHTGYEPKSCIDVSSEHTPINHPSRRNSFNIEKDFTTTVAASQRTPTVCISKR